MESHKHIKSLFASVPLAQKISDKLVDLSKMKTAHLKNPDNEIYKDERIRLTVQCGELYLKNNDFKNAKIYFEQAGQLAGAEHAYSLDISTHLLDIAEREALSSGASAAAKK